jgi:hypothetical protein
LDLVSFLNDLDFGKQFAVLKQGSGGVSGGASNSKSNSNSGSGDKASELQACVASLTSYLVAAFANSLIKEANIKTPEALIDRLYGMPDRVTGVVYRSLKETSSSSSSSHVGAAVSSGSGGMEASAKGTQGNSVNSNGGSGGMLPSVMNSISSGGSGSSGSGGGEKQDVSTLNIRSVIKAWASLNDPDDPYVIAAVDGCISLFDKEVSIKEEHQASSSSLHVVIASDPSLQSWLQNHVPHTNGYLAQRLKTVMRRHKMKGKIAVDQVSA